MKAEKRLGIRFRYGVFAVAAVASALVLATGAGAKQPFSAKGQFVEGCSCSGVCPCDMTGIMEGCQGLGAVSLSGGRYMGKDLSGSKIVYAVEPGKWVRLYVQPRTPAQSAAVKAFARSVYTPFGKVESVRDARIGFAGTGGRYTVTVDGGKVAKFVTVPVMGGNSKSPIVHTNVKDTLNKTMMQGKTVSGSYNDAGHSFTLKDSNSFFNGRMNAAGRV